MEAIRSVQTVENGEIHIQLPEQFWGQEVEIIVLSSSQQYLRPVSPKKSLRGCLSRYANPALLNQEQDAWQIIVSEKHEYC